MRLPVTVTIPPALSFRRCTARAQNLLLVLLLVFSSADALVRPYLTRRIPLRQQDRDRDRSSPSRSLFGRPNVEVAPLPLQRRRRPLDRIRPPSVGAVAVALVALLIRPPHALAAVGQASLRMTPRLVWTTLRRHGRQLFWTVMTAWLVSATMFHLQVRVRLRRDATSEWGRYAHDPAARARALGKLMLQLLPPWILAQCLSKKSARRRRILQASGHRLAQGLLQLGPLYIKLGQIVSCREHFLPVEWRTALERLQDQVPSRTGDEALELAYNAWPGGQEHFHAVFGEFDTTPLAAASLGQVHRATLRDSGDAVAIKLQRPFLREIYDQDLALLMKIASTVDRFGGTAGQVGGVSQSWVEIFKEAENILYREIDYRDEADNMLRFCRDFGIAKGGKPAKEAAAVARDGKPLPSAAPWLRAPIVYEKLSSEKFLVMEFVPSIKITSTDKLDQANITAEQKEYLADMLGRSYLRQFCCNLFFSTDPHPGNLGVEILNPEATDPESRVRLVFYDFGQAASLTPNQADGILTIIEAIVDSDVERSIESFQQMRVLKDDADLDAVRAKVAENYRTGKVKANRKRLKRRGYQFKKASNSTSSTKPSNSTATDLQVMQYFTLPTEYAFVGRALSQMDGVGKSLDPEFDFISSAAPWIYEIKGAGKYLLEEFLKWRDQFCDKFYKAFPFLELDDRRQDKVS